MIGVLLFISIPIIQNILQKLLLKKLKNRITFQLDQKYIDEFIRNGIVVIPNILNEEEIIEVRREFHLSLKKYGCDVTNLEETAGKLSNLSSTGGAGGILDIFYEEWKLKLNEHPNIVFAINSLFHETYQKCSNYFTHPYEKFDSNKSFMYIDRLCFRVPEFISQKFSVKKKSLHRSLTPHLDCCPHKLYTSEKEYPKWRPIQAFIALTDTLNINEGGFEAHPGFHIKFNDWVKQRKPSATMSITTSYSNKKTKKLNDNNNNNDNSNSNNNSNNNNNNSNNSYDNDNKIQNEPPCLGEFTPIRPIEDKEVFKGMTHIPCRAGDLVCWDYRIPHSNSRRNDSSIPREVVYIGVLPGIQLNYRYSKNQLERYLEGKVPIDQWHEHEGLQKCDYKFSELGQKMMTIKNYD